MRALLAALLLMSSSLLAVDYSTVTHLGKKFTVCRVHLQRETLRLFLNDGANKPLNTFDHLSAWLTTQGDQLTFAMNAGMYHGDFSPVGLCVIQGREVAPLNLGNGNGTDNFYKKPNGVFLITDKGAQVVDSVEYPALKVKPLLATQSGPLLLRQGRLHPAIREGSANVLFRNGVGVYSADEVVFAISEEPVNFHTLATLFRDALQCKDALFLDGTISSLYAPPLKRNDKKMDMGPMIGVTVKP